jgi:predicted outer membrane repeat protein
MMQLGRGQRSGGSARILLAPLVVALSAALVDSANAATIVVDDPSEGSVVGHCTVQDAVTALNTQAAVNTCVAGDGSSDTIDLTGFTSPTTITFTSGPTHVGGNDSALAFSRVAAINGALDGNGQPLVTLQRSTVSGTPAFRLVTTGADLSVDGLGVANGGARYAAGIYATGSANLTISHARITGNAGYFGGGIGVTSGTIALDNSTISGNSARYGGAIYAPLGAVTITDSTISNNSANYGGGVCILIPGAAPLSVTHSSFVGNTATGAHGGAIIVTGTITLTDTTLSGNRASKSGGAVYAFTGLTVSGSTLSGNYAGGRGGAVLAKQTATFTNSTISGNVAVHEGGAIHASDANLYFSTVYANAYTTVGAKGAGIYFTNSAAITASIVTGNGGDDVDAPSNIPVTGAYNIMAATGVGVPPDTQNCSVVLGPLANFGGATKTMPLLGGSCAIDAGPFSPSVLVDQRGSLRPIQLVWPAPRADVGAFEKQDANDPDLIFIDGFGVRGSD